MYWAESKVLEYSGNMRHNLAAPDVFAEVVKVINQTVQGDTELA